LFGDADIQYAAGGSESTNLTSLNKADFSELEPAKELFSSMWKMKEPIYGNNHI
jgi:hypothetical protein